MLTQPLIFIIFSFAFGLVIGSFLNVCIHRIPLKQSIITPPSSCPDCGKLIRFYDNIPLVSYLLLLGKCRRCGHRIPVRYPIVELITGLLSISLFMIYGISFQYLVFLLFSASMIVVSFIDIKWQIIPDVISIPGIVIGLIISFILPHIEWHESLIGIIVGGGVLYLVAFGFQWLTGKDGMGGGDIKLLAMIGAWMGWGALPFVVLLSSLIGVLIGGASLILSKKGLRARIPFGPFLALGALIYIFFGRELISWYFGLILY